MAVRVPPQRRALYGGFVPAFLAITFLLLTVPAMASGPLINITIGGLYPLTPADRTNAGMQREMASLLALDAISQSSTILPGIRLLLESRDTAAKPEQGSTGMFELANTHRVPCVIGAASSGVSMAAAQIGGIFSVPLVSYSSTSAKLSNKQIYPYFAYAGGGWLRCLPSASLSHVLCVLLFGVRMQPHCACGPAASQGTGQALHVLGVG